MIIICALCHQQGERSSANPRLCKPCNRKLNKYKRLVVKDRAKLPPGNIKLLEQMEAMFEHNKQHGGYVPQFYGKLLYEGTCLKRFKWVSGNDICPNCRKDKTMFYSYYSNYGLVGKAAEYYDYYLDLYRKGRKVPQLFIDLYTGKKK